MRRNLRFIDCSMLIGGASDLKSDDPAGTDPGEKARRARTDALHNRDKLVQVARAAFAAADGTVPLEGIAREAGVGIGMLYRHLWRSARSR